MLDTLRATQWSVHAEVERGFHALENEACQKLQWHSHCVLRVFVGVYVCAAVPQLAVCLTKWKYATRSTHDHPLDIPQLFFLYFHATSRSQNFTFVFSLLFLPRSRLPKVSPPPSLVVSDRLTASYVPLGSPFCIYGVRLCGRFFFRSHRFSACYFLLSAATTHEKQNRSTMHASRHTLADSVVMWNIAR